MRAKLLAGLIVLLAGCDVQMKTRSLPPEETNHGLEMTTDDQGRLRVCRKFTNIAWAGSS